MSIPSALEQIKSELPSSCQLIAVSKGQSVEKIQAAYLAGQVDFGENKVQELKLKADEFSPPELQWHFIGGLQSNKINQLLQVPGLKSIHSIDSSKLLHKLLSKTPDNLIELFLQVNTSKEEQKGGLALNYDFAELMAQIDKHPRFKFKGFMTIGKIRTESFEKDANECFMALSKLREKYAHNRQIDLSMGMSSDYRIALNHQTNWVRIGSKIFGERS